MLILGEITGKTAFIEVIFYMNFFVKNPAGIKMGRYKTVVLYSIPTPFFLKSPSF